MHPRTTVVISFMILLTSCVSQSEPTSESVAPEPSRIVISEILAGEVGNNNKDFIELYNTGAEIVDLNGWELLYRLTAEKEPLSIYRCETRTLIPPHGHFLLGREGELLEVGLDAAFSQSLVPTRGGLQLVDDTGEVVDQISWGEGPEQYREGSAAPAMQNGVALERRPGGDSGNSLDNGDNLGDFRLNEAPLPQSTGSPVTPLEDPVVRLTLRASSHGQTRRRNVLSSFRGKPDG